LAAVHDVGLLVYAEADFRAARCPACGPLSGRVHSRYTRTVADLPWRGIAVTLRVHARRFFCGAASCERRIFCERLAEVAGFEWYWALFEDAELLKEISKQKLKTPVLALGGGARMGEDVRCSLEQITENVSGVLERCGHYVAEERTQELSRQFVDFFCQEISDCA